MRKHLFIFFFLIVLNISFLLQIPCYASEVKVEICNSPTYQNATIKVEQPVITVTDSTLIFDFRRGSLPFGENWLFVTNNQGLRNTAGYKIYINKPPHSVNDQEVTEEDHSISIDVLANDTDQDGSLDPSSVTISQHPQHGDVLNQGNGIVTYTPINNYFGSDSFAYKVHDNHGIFSNIATVFINRIQILLGWIVYNIEYKINKVPGLI